MQKCGRCHEEIAKTYFDTYHGKVSQLGYTKTAKCYDCHGAHDIQQVTRPALAPLAARTWSRPARSATRARRAASPAT